MLLVDHDQPEVGDRREHGRARADGDPRLAGPQPPPLVVALALAERRVQQRHRVAEPSLEAGDGLRRQRDLRHQHDHPAPARERLRARAQVDLGLARPGDAVQQLRAALPDGGDRGVLLGRELHRAVGGRVGPRRPPPRPRRDRDQPAHLEPPQRPAVVAGGPGQPLQQRPLVAGQPLAVEAGGGALGPQQRPLAARAAAVPATGRARASSSTRRPSTARAPRGRAGTVSVRTPVARTSLLRRHLGIGSRASTTTPSSFWRPNGIRTTDPTRTGSSGGR